MLQSVDCKESDMTEQQQQRGSTTYENQCDTPCVHLLTLIISVYFLPSLTQTPCPAKSFMPEACSHIPYREGLDLLFLLTKLGPTCWGVSLSLWCNGNSWLWSQRLSSAGYFLSQPQFSGL